MKKINSVILYTREDVCQMFGCGTNTAQNLFYNNEFPAIKIGRDWYVEEQALLSYLQDRHILAELKSKKRG